MGADSDRRISRRGNFDPDGDSRIDEVGTATTSIPGTGRIFGAVLPVWVLGGTRGEVEVHIARSPRGSGGSGDLSGAYSSRAGALGLHRGTRAEVDRWSEWGMDGGARSAISNIPFSRFLMVFKRCSNLLQLLVRESSGFSRYKGESFGSPVILHSMIIFHFLKWGD